MKFLKKLFKTNTDNTKSTHDQLMLSDDESINTFGNEPLQVEPQEQNELPRYAELTPFEAPPMQKALLSQPKPVFTALINSDELKAFFAQKYFNRGRHNGANFGTQAILLNGKNAIVAEFKHCLHQMDGKRRSKITEMKNHMESTKDGFRHFDEAMKMKISLLEEEVQIINNQLTLCEEYDGWIEGPLRLYQSGFIQGLTFATRYRFN